MNSHRDPSHHRRRRWPLVAAGTVVAVLAAGGAAYAGARKDVTLNVAGSDLHVTTLGGTVGSLLASQHVVVGSHDAVEPAEGTKVYSGETVDVRYGREVTASIDGKMMTVWTTALDANGALESLAARGQNVTLVANRSQGNGRAALPPELDAHGPIAVVADGKTHVVADAAVGVDTVLSELGITVGPLDRVVVEQRSGTPRLALVVQRHAPSTHGAGGATEAGHATKGSTAGKEAPVKKPEAAAAVVPAAPPAPKPASGSSSRAATRNANAASSTAPRTATKPTPAAVTHATPAPAPKPAPAHAPKPAPKPKPILKTHDVTKTSFVKFTTQQIKAPDLPKGLIVVKYHGHAGKIERTYAVTTRNGVKVATKFVSTKTTRVENTVILVGTMPPPASSPDPAPQPITASPSEAQGIARSMMGEHGWDGAQFSCLVSLWNNESGWHVNADNRSSGAYGIPQALPSTKMATVASDWRTNARTQIIWGLDYISGRYGSPCGAWNHELQVDWY